MEFEMSTQCLGEQFERQFAGIASVSSLHQSASMLPLRGENGLVGTRNRIFTEMKSLLEAILAMEWV